MASFHAMGTEVTVLAPCSPLCVEEQLTQQVADVFERAEQTFSRFRADSLLSQINRCDVPLSVPDEMFDVLVRAQRYTRLTGGMFDPTIGAGLLASGYHVSFAPFALDRDADRSSAPEPALGTRGLWLDPSARTVQRAKGALLDLGGMVKGYAADEAARILPSCAAVDAGGDAVLRGDGPDGAGWLVDIEDPHDAARTLMTLRVREAAVATSAANRRRWRIGGRTMHHLIDPRTGVPSRTDLAQVTVVAPTAEVADVLAKTLFLLGKRAAVDFVARLPDAAAVLVSGGGDVTCVGKLEVSRD